MMILCRKMGVTAKLLCPSAGDVGRFMFLKTDNIEEEMLEYLLPHLFVVITMKISEALWTILSPICSDGLTIPLSWTIHVKWSRATKFDIFVLSESFVFLEIFHFHVSLIRGKTVWSAFRLFISVDLLLDFLYISNDQRHKMLDHSFENVLRRTAG